MPFTKRIGITGGGGGGGGATINDRRWVKGSTAYTQDDEFASGVLDAKWSRVDNGAPGAARATWTVEADSVSLLLLGSDAASEQHALLQTYTLLTNEAVVAHMEWANNNGASNMAGLMLADGNTYGAGNQLFFGVEAANTYGLVYGPNYTGFNAFGAGGANLTGPGQYQNNKYLRIVNRGGNNYDLDISADGTAASWVNLATVAWAHTPSRIGLSGGYLQAANKANFSFDFFRLYKAVP